MKTPHSGAHGNMRKNTATEMSQTSCISAGRPEQVRGPMQDLGAGPRSPAVLLRHRGQSTVL